MGVVLGGYVLALADALGRNLASGWFFAAVGLNPQMPVDLEMASATAD